MSFIHPSADVEPDVVIGDDTKVWHLCHLRSGARIGEGCTLGRGVYVSRGTAVGNRVKIESFAYLAAGVSLEDGVFIGPHVTFTDDRVPRSVNPDMSLKTRADWIEGRTLVRQGASIGANATIICGVTIGRWAVVGAGSVVTRDVPDFAKVVGSPGRVIGYVCRCGKPIARPEDVASCPSCGAFEAPEVTLRIPGTRLR
jgi:acetyltransferase-like isoleucine patch superfamily enzyme